MERRDSTSSGHLREFGFNQSRGKLRFGEFLDDDSRYLNSNAHLIKKRVCIGFIVVIVFTVGILLGVFSSRVTSKDVDQEFGICRLTNATTNITGSLSVSRQMTQFIVSGSVNVSSAQDYFITLETSGDPSNCAGKANGPSILIKSKLNNDISWKSSDVTSNYLFGRVLKLCSEAGSCGCCIIARTD